jgi:hypothetical protein
MGEGVHPNGPLRTLTTCCHSRAKRPREWVAITEYREALTKERATPGNEQYSVKSGVSL